MAFKKDTFMFPFKSLICFSNISLTLSFLAWCFLVNSRLQVIEGLAQNTGVSNICEDGTFAIGNVTEYKRLRSGGRSGAVEECKTLVHKMNENFYRKPPQKLEKICSSISPKTYVLAVEPHSDDIQLTVKIAYCCTTRSIHERYLFDLEDSCKFCGMTPKCNNFSKSGGGSRAPDVKFLNATDNACQGVEK